MQAFQDDLMKTIFRKSNSRNSFVFTGTLIASLLLVLGCLSFNSGLFRSKAASAAAAQATAGHTGAGQQTGESARRPTVAAGAYHSLTLKSDGTVVAWGANEFGQANVPAGLSGVTAIDAGHYHNLALRVGVSSNTAPTAVNDAYTTTEDTALNVPANGVLGNDTDGENNSLTATLVTNAANGSVTLNPDGSFNYTPNANFHGADSFTYKANDGQADSNTATVSITVWEADTDGDGIPNSLDNCPNTPNPEKVAFSSSRDGNAEIYVMNADGTNPTRLTNNAATDVDPTFSPDGSKIAFYSNRDGDNEIYVMNSDGTNQTRLTNNSASDVQPSFGAQADSNHNGIGDVCENTAPTISGATLTRIAGSPGSNSQIATVNDAESGASGVTVTITSANPSNGVTVSNIVNSGGNITADIVAACAATTANFTLQVSDGTSTATATLTVTVTSETQAPSITCPANVSVNTAVGQCQAVATYTTPTATDNCPGVTVSCSPASGTAFSKGGYHRHLYSNRCSDCS
jgi:VCBS repeat-containing protein